MNILSLRGELLLIKIEKTEVCGWEAAIRGARNPMNSWHMSDTAFNKLCSHTEDIHNEFTQMIIGEKDLELMRKLTKAGSEHGKFMRYIQVTCDITAPLYWWKEYDTYKVSTVANSCSTMHKIQEKEFELFDFSHEHLDIRTIEVLKNIIDVFNDYRKLYLNYNADDFEVTGCPSKKDIWWQMIQLLPSSYNQKRTVLLNYQVLKNIYHSRNNHKLDEWSIGFCNWVLSLPYSELIIEN